MTKLPLRLRVFLFFGFLAAASVAVAWLGLFMGYRQFGNESALSSFVTAGLVAAFGLPAVSVAIWLLFDTNVAKPIEALAASLRVGEFGSTDTSLAEDIAPYLGDLGPAAVSVRKKLGALSGESARRVVSETERLRRHRQQLVEILSDIPIATLLVTAEHQIVLYDGQAAELMAREAPVRLNANLFEYLEKGPVAEALAASAERDRPRLPVTVTGRSGAPYTGHIRRFENGCYALLLDALDVSDARPLTYDLDLLDKHPPVEVENTPLRDLTFVVFDSETTGLDARTDAVVQLGAVRIVNGKIVSGEVFDRLVNPGRPIPPLATKVHGISDEMVQAAPRFTEVATEFHAFSSGSVLVAHNAPFDVAFLNREAENGAPTFQHAVLDTVHLSAIVFGGSATHTLDALCERLDIEIPEEVRHTALGDALATARVVCALLPILEERGLVTLKQVLEECRKHRRILEMV